MAWKQPEATGVAQRQSEPETGAYLLFEDAKGLTGKRPDPLTGNQRVRGSKP